MTTQPQWADLVITGGQIDVTRVQMIFFTEMCALFVPLKVGATDAIPEIPANYLLLMGMSNGVYFAAKFTSANGASTPQSQSVADPQTGAPSPPPPPPPE
jgi:hypothetical protein